MPVTVKNYRRAIGDHVNFCDRRQGSPREQKELIRQLTARPGLHSRNVRTHQGAHLLMLVMCCVSANRYADTGLGQSLARVDAQGKSLPISYRNNGPSSGENDALQAMLVQVISSTTTRTLGALSDAGMALSYYDPLRFPGADASLLENGSVDPKALRTARRVPRELPPSWPVGMPENLDHDGVDGFISARAMPIIEEDLSLKAVEQKLNEIYNRAYPAIGLQAESLIRQALVEILNEKGVGHLTPDSEFLCNIYQYSAGYGHVPGDTAPDSTRLVTLYDLARGALYKEAWNGHIEVVGLPDQLKALFRRNRYWGSRLFEITETLNAKIAPKLNAFKDEKSAHLRKRLWEGKIRGTLSTLAQDMTRPAQARAAFRAVLEGRETPRLVHLEFMQGPIKSTILVQRDNSTFILIDVNSGRTVLMPQSSTSNCKFSEKKKKELREFFAKQMGVVDLSRHLADNGWDGFSPVLDRTSPVGGTIYCRRQLSILSTDSIDDAAEYMQRAEAKAAEADANFLLTTADEVRLKEAMELGRMSAETLSYIMLMAPQNGVMLTYDIILNVYGYALDETAVRAAESPALREKERRSRNRNLIYSFTTAVSPPVANRILERYKALSRVSPA